MSHEKRVKNGQSRAGSAARRLMEFKVIKDQVKRRKEAFIARLQRNISTRASGCLLYKGTLDHNGYPRINFRHPRMGHVTISANRVFAILQNCAPIPLGREAAHMDGCTNRRCVRHIGLLPYEINARTQGAHANIPF